MASIFRGRRSKESEEDRGAGGKMLKGRSRAMEVAVSPYARPQRSTAQSQSPKWISSLISGAGKIISSVFGSQSSSPSSSSSGCSSELLFIRFSCFSGDILVGGFDFERSSLFALMFIFEHEGLIWYATCLVR